MRRRDFIEGIVGLATAWPLAARAQVTAKLLKIGILGTDAVAWRAWTDAFTARLGELGWVDGHTVAIEYRWAEGRRDRYAEFADEFVRMKADVIVAPGSAVPTLVRATSTIPIVFALTIDPLGAGLVASLARPGGNVTGLSLEQADTAGKRLELFRKAVPNLHRLAVLLNADFPEAAMEMSHIQASARTIDIGVTPLEIRRAEDIAVVFDAFNSRADALYVVSDSLVTASRTRIITLATAARLPTMFTTREFVQVGGFMSYGPNYVDQFRRAADLVDKILHGTKPGDIPVEQPTKFELVINLTTAKVLGLTIPPTLLAIADEVIE
jgi:putative tryptophan/tyrosine transport system substrate-binding protein